SARKRLGAAHPVDRRSLRGEPGRDGGLDLRRCCPAGGSRGPGRGLAGGPPGSHPRGDGARHHRELAGVGRPGPGGAGALSFRGFGCHAPVPLAPVREDERCVRPDRLLDRRRRVELSGDLSPDALARIVPGRALRAYPAMLSTESEAAAWARAGAPEGAFVVAGYQASPRGRGGISWQVDHHHDLAFSLILRPQLPALREGGWRGESSFAHIRALRSYVRRPPRDAKSRPGAAWSR